MNNATNNGRATDRDLHDAELLRQYVEKGSERAFQQIVERHVSLVYAVCRRRLWDANKAEQATIETFTVFSRQAKSFMNGPPFCNRPLVAFLYETAVSVSGDVRDSRHVYVETSDMAGVADLVFGRSA
jgi:DNA-directed RNA polymerase specialized sigma24 family protein